MSDSAATPGPLLIAISGWRPDRWLQLFKERAGGREVFDAREPFDPAAIRFVAAWKPTPGQLVKLPNLKAIFNLGAGVDALLADHSLPDVPICRIVDEDLTKRMSEYVVMQVLMQLRQVEAYRAQQCESRWLPIEQPSASQVRVGIMGMGVLGKDAAEILTRIGFQVSGWSRNRQSGMPFRSFAGENERAAFLAQSDILVVLLPLTPETHGILARPLFEGLARDGVLGGPAIINAGRGGLQNEADILACLADGTLRHATLDVFEAEPLPSASPLWLHPKVQITPHVAADSNPVALVDVVLGNIARFEKDGVLSHVVDRKTGY